ncbi:MAG: STAS domain-containing protein [Ruminococcus sp.]|nr:STAS domain-containing protein [Ruminococcus sp.]
MDIKLVDRGEVGELILSGKLDSRCICEAEAVFLQVAERFRNVTFNLRELKFISNSGLRAMKKVYMKLREKNGEMSVINASQSMVSVIEMTGYAEICNIR